MDRCGNMKSFMLMKDDPSVCTCTLKHDLRPKTLLTIVVEQAFLVIFKCASLSYFQICSTGLLLNSVADCFATSLNVCLSLSSFHNFKI